MWGSEGWGGVLTLPLHPWGGDGTTGMAPIPTCPQDNKVLFRCGSLSPHKPRGVWGALRGSPPMAGGRWVLFTPVAGLVWGLSPSLVSSWERSPRASLLPSPAAH